MYGVWNTFRSSDASASTLTSCCRSPEDLLPVFWLKASFGCWIWKRRGDVGARFFPGIISCGEPPACSLVQFAVFPWHVSWHVSLCGFSHCQEAEQHRELQSRHCTSEGKPEEARVREGFQWRTWGRIWGRTQWIIDGCWLIWWRTLIRNFFVKDHQTQPDAAQGFLGCFLVFGESGSTSCSSQEPFFKNHNISHEKYQN